MIVQKIKGITVKCYYTDSDEIKVAYEIPNGMLANDFKLFKMRNEWNIKRIKHYAHLHRYTSKTYGRYIYYPVDYKGIPEMVNLDAKKEAGYIDVLFINPFDLVLLPECRDNDALYTFLHTEYLFELERTHTHRTLGHIKEEALFRIESTDIHLYPVL